MPRRLVRFAAPLVFAPLLAACGGSGGSGSAAKAQTVEIAMRDTAFSPDQVTVTTGSVVRLVFHNTGNVAHEAFLGNDQAQMNHEMEMGSPMGGMSHSDVITVAPGQTGTLMHTFHSGDHLVIGCHEPGHYAAGMKALVTVR